MDIAKSRDLINHVETYPRFRVRCTSARARRLKCFPRVGDGALSEMRDEINRRRLRRGGRFDSSPLITHRSQRVPHLDTVPALMRVILPTRRDSPTRLRRSACIIRNGRPLNVFQYSRVELSLGWHIQPRLAIAWILSPSKWASAVVTTKRPCIGRHGRYLSRQIHDELTFSETRELRAWRV